MLAITLLEADRQQLERWSSASGVPAYVALRSRIVLAAAKGQGNKAICDELHVSNRILHFWCCRFEQDGLNGLWELPSKPGRKRSIPTPVLSEADQQKLQEWISASTTPQRVALRCRIVLAASQGLSIADIVRQLRVCHTTVDRWRRCVQEKGVNGLWEEAPGRGRKPTYGPEKIQAIVKALRTKTMTQYEIAEHYGVSDTTVNRICKVKRLRRYNVNTL